MNTQHPQIAFILLFPFMWCGVCLLLSYLGGWHRLARQFKALTRPEGIAHYGQSGSVGIVAYRSCLTVYTNPDGIFISVWPLFRIAHPTLFIPWTSIFETQEITFFIIRKTRFTAEVPPTTIRLGSFIADAALKNTEQGAAANP